MPLFQELWSTLGDIFSKARIAMAMRVSEPKDLIAMLQVGQVDTVTKQEKM